MSNNLTLSRGVHMALTAAATAAAAHAPDAMAQQAPAAKDTSLEEVVVTGSRIRRVDIETASPVFVIDQAAIQQSGISTVGDLVQRLPSVSGAATNPQVNNGGGFGESNIELRGLDAKRTLILLDGRRLGIVGASDATDVNQIPVASIERVEVLKEGAGAIYGSDAIAGVVNFITRKNLEGLEVHADYGRTSRSDGAHHAFDVAFGTSTDKINFSVIGSYTKQESVSAADRDFSKFALYLYGGTYGSYKSGSSRTPTGRISLPAGPLRALYAVAPATSCTSITRSAGATGTSLADYRCFIGNFGPNSDRFNYQPQNLLLTPQERASIFTKLNYQLNDYVETYASVLYNRTHSGYEIAQLPFDAQVDDVVISKDNYYNPFGIDFGGLGGTNPNALWRLVNFGDRTSDATSASTILSLGAKGKLLDTGWNWDLSLGYSRLDQLASIGNYFLKSKFQAALGPSGLNNGNVVCGQPDLSGNVPDAAVIADCTPVNVFNLNGPGQAEALALNATRYNTNNTSRYKSAALDFNGKLADLPGGELLASVGVEYAAPEGSFIPDGITIASAPLYLQCQVSNEACSGVSKGKYNSKQMYLELFVPLLKDLPGVHSLNIDLGTRYSDYSLFGNATKSQFKLEYRPVSDLLIRGTHSQVFRVPTILDIAAAPVNTSVTFNDPCTNLTPGDVATNPNLALACVNVVQDGTFGNPNGQITGVITSNASLKPESGKVTTFGLVYDPRQIPNLSFEVDYWKYKIENLITVLDATYSINQCIQRADPTFCNLVTRLGPTTADPGQILVFLQPTFNLGELNTDGVDIGVKYALKNTRAGSFQFNFDLTRINKYDNIPAPGAAAEQIVGTYNRQFGNYAKYRGLASVGWGLKNFDGLLSARYIHKLKLLNPSVSGVDGNGDPYPDLAIPSFTYVDLTLGYTFPTKTKVQLGVRNLTDKQAPILYQNNVTNANTDVQTYDTIGRQWFFGFNQKF
jgi:iron complex outermembrane recepter protein